VARPAVTLFQATVLNRFSTWIAIGKYWIMELTFLNNDPATLVANNCSQSPRILKGGRGDFVAIWNVTCTKCSSDLLIFAESVETRHGGSCIMQSSRLQVLVRMANELLWLCQSNESCSNVLISSRLDTCMCLTTFFQKDNMYFLCSRTFEWRSSLWRTYHD